MFSLDYKIEFLIIWVASVLFCAALMIKAEYKYHQFQLMLGLIDENEDDEYDDERLED